MKHTGKYDGEGEKKIFQHFTWLSCEKIKKSSWNTRTVLEFYQIAKETEQEYLIENSWIITKYDKD